MYFTNDELKRMPDDVRVKAMKINKNHYLSAYSTILSQKEAWENEMKEKPFTIRAQAINTEDGVIESNRQDSETALKIIKILPELAKDLEELYNKLTTDEKSSVDYASDAKEIQSKVLEKVNELKGKKK